MNNDDPHRQLKERLRGCVKSCGEKLKSEDFEVQQQTVITGNPANRENKKVVDVPSKVSILPHNKKSYFEETAEWLYESNLGPEIDGSSEKLADNIYLFKYINWISDLAITTFRYSGGYDISNDAFEAAFEDSWLRRFKERKRYKLLIPIRYLSGIRRVMELSPVKIPTDGPDHHEINSVKIVPSGIENHRYYNAILAYEDQPLSPVVHHDNDENTFLIADMIGTKVPESPIEVGSRIAGRVTDVLRLFAPTNGLVFMGPTYLIEPGWLDFREGIPTITKASNPPIEAPQTFLGFGNPEMFEFPNNDFNKFLKFWRRFAPQLDYNRSGEFCRSMERFSGMYHKRTLEDRIIECAVALENTLMRGPSRKMSITYQLSLRASILLDQFVESERKDIRNLVKNIYSARSEIVHENATLDEIVTSAGFLPYELQRDLRIQYLDKEEGEFSSPNLFVLHARHLLAKVIIGYLHHNIELGLGIQETNEKRIDPAIKNAPYSLEITELQ